MSNSKYVDVFFGSGEINLPKPEGIANKWCFLKACCGNTTPAACVPFGAMSVAPYSGGYPTGYGNHVLNTYSSPPKFEDGEKIYGFTHIQQTGIGAMGYYYNYCLVTPVYEKSEERRPLQDESAYPGYYFCKIENIICELTSTRTVAVHRYRFEDDGGAVRLDFSNSGLHYDDEHRGTVENLKIKTDGNYILASANIEGIDIFFAVAGNGELSVENSVAIYKNFGRESNLKVSVSLVSCEKALERVNGTADFDTVRNDAKTLWDNALGSIDIKVKDKKIRELFYSCFYHSITKPSNWSGESFIYEKGKPFYADFATLWDMYKTQLPLVFMLYRENAEDICETILSTGEKLGHIPNSLGLCTRFAEHDTQARTLGCYVLLTAYRYGVKIDVHRMLKMIDRDIFAPNKIDFTVDGRCKSHTFMLDMADCCALTSQVAKEVGETEIYNRLQPLSQRWKDCYSLETGLLKDDSEYYEGTLYNYSFRQMADMDERIKIAGGKEKFVKLLDDFFGYGKPDTVQPSKPLDYEPIRIGFSLGRFEGFNNESDTEAPYSYVYADRHDRVCEVIRAGMKYMFTTGRGGLPGNNDTGALSSYYVLASLGLFPVAGQNLFIIGSPAVDEAEIKLFNSNVLTIKVDNNSDENIYVKSVKFNGRNVDEFMLSATELMSGGILEFEMFSK